MNRTSAMCWALRRCKWNLLQLTRTHITIIAWLRKNYYSSFFESDAEHKNSRCIQTATYDSDPGLAVIRHNINQWISGLCNTCIQCEIQLTWQHTSNIDIVIKFVILPCWQHYIIQYTLHKTTRYTVTYKQKVHDVDVHTFLRFAVQSLMKNPPSFTGYHG